MTKISTIVKNDLCLGCGLCSAIDSNCTMKLNAKGFYRPHFQCTISESEKIITAICPGIHVHATKTKKNTSVWGNIETVSNAWATDRHVRQSSSSGGVTSALAIYLLESHQVDAVLHVGKEQSSFLYNKLHISKNKDEILSRNASRYAPALIFDHIFDILNANTDTYAFIGKPCDITGIKNLLAYYPKYQNRIKFFLAIFCAGMPSYNATMKAIQTFGNPTTPLSLQYRGNGWPGYFTVKFENGSTSQMTYNDSWGKILGRDIGLRCKICPDGIGLLADIASGDAWNTKDGYPDFTESDGKNFCFIRTQNGKKLFDAAVKAGYITEELLNVNSVRDMQNYQYTRRHYVGWRIAIVQLLSGGILSFKNLGYEKMALKANYKKGIKEALGTIKRYNKARKRNG